MLHLVLSNVTAYATRRRNSDQRQMHLFTKYVFFIVSSSLLSNAHADVEDNFDGGRDTNVLDTKTKTAHPIGKGPGFGTDKTRNNDSLQRVNTGKKKREATVFDPFLNNGNDNLQPFASSNSRRNPTSSNIFSNFFSRFRAGGTGNNAPINSNNSSFYTDFFPYNPLSNYPNVPMSPATIPIASVPNPFPICAEPDPSSYGDTVSNVAMPANIQEQILEEVSSNSTLKALLRFAAANNPQSPPPNFIQEPGINCPSVFRRATVFKRYQGNCWILLDEVYYATCRCQLCIPPAGGQQREGSQCIPLILPVSVFAFCENIADQNQRSRIKREIIRRPVVCFCRHAILSDVQFVGAGGFGALTSYPAYNGFNSFF